MKRGRSRALLLVAFTAVASSCTPPGATAEVVLELDAYGASSLAGFREAQALLSITDDKGAPATAELKLLDGTQQRATSPIPLQCFDTSCSVDLDLDAGSYLFSLEVSALDRCDARGALLGFSSGPEPIVLGHWEGVPVNLVLETAAYDDDDDGIVNIFELPACGRFDQADRALPPQSCVDSADPCCSSPSPLEGQRSVFAGGDHTLASGAVVNVAPFSLDATEVTWRSLFRCVAAGACLAAQPDHPARVALDDASLDLRTPVTGLSPREAAELCAWKGDRLPDDVEWDFAAAHRDSGTRGTYPFELGLDDDAFLECREGVGMSANYAARDRDCPDAPAVVGSYASTFITRGSGSPLADLAGNVSEWTVRSGTGVSHPDLPDGAVEVDVRGGGTSSFIELLENDIELRVIPGSDPAVFHDRLAALASTTGFRCASTVTDVVVAAEPSTEPACVGGTP